MGSVSTPSDLVDYNDFRIFYVFYLLSASRNFVIAIDAAYDVSFRIKFIVSVNLGAARRAHTPESVPRSHPSPANNNCPIIPLSLAGLSSVGNY